MYEEPKTVGVAAVLKRFQNFWYHKKAAVIIFIVALFAITVMVAQCASREKYEANILLAVGLDLGVITEQDLKNAIDEIFDGTGTKPGLRVFYYVKSVTLDDEKLESGVTFG